MANYEAMGEMKYANIWNSVDVPIITGLRTIRKLSAAATYKAGTALALSGGTAGDGKLVILGTAAASNETLTANCILAEDVEVGTDADVQALVYLSGHANANKLVVASSHTITAAEIEAFRAAGIYLENAM
jgi:hypothetical protein|nr:MAG TPA: Head decoration protein [Caudoviricetes sp.]